MKLLFIITAHENNDCVEDTINNIKKFNVDIEPLIAIHISEKFTTFDEQRFSNLQNVIFIRNQAKTFDSKWESQLLPILRTYQYAKKQFSEDFEYVKIFHTSELFVRHGFYDYIKNFDTSFDTRTDQLPERYFPIFDMGLFTKEETIYYQGVELGFFSKEIFEYIVEDCNKFPISIEEVNNFFNYTPVEEVIIPTIAMKYAKRIGRNVTVIKMNIEDINLTGTLFTLKSVPRDINHPVRIKIKEL
jgi:hypothetical protein